jgi:hypothetical protein
MKQSVVIVFLFFTVLNYSQTIRLEGTVQDTLKKPLEMANVMAINQETKGMDSYGITNDKGRFQLNLKPNAIYKIKVSYIGFQSLETTIETKGENLQKIITLKEGDVNLEGVEVVYEMPVSISGDTIIYNADSFKTGTEKKLEDILKKLPGVEVNADGEIEVEGKKVTQLLVDGKKFFEGDTKLGAKNIPSDAVDKVQVLRNYTEVSQLRGLENNNEDIAINIKLKKGKNKFWFGDISAGVGPDERYIINPKLFYYSPNTSLNVISNFNNIGDVPFSLRDYFRLTGGSRNTIGRNGTNFNVSSNDLGISTQRNDRAEEINTKFGAVNFTQQMSKTWNLSGFAVLSSDETRTNTQSRNEYYQPNSTEIETEEKRSDISNVTNNLAIFKIGSKYKPSATFQLDYDVSLKRSNQRETNALETMAQTEGVEIFNSINSFKKQDPITLNQSLNMFWTQNEKSTWAFEMQHLYQDEDPLYNPQLTNNPFPFIDDFDTNQSFFNINQSRFVKTSRIDAKVDYYYSLTSKSNLNFTFGNTYSYQSYNSAIFQILDNGTELNLNEDIYNNDVRYSFNDAFLATHYKFITGKFTFNPGLSFHRYTTFNRQLDTKTEDNFSRILPDVFAQYQLKKSESITYTYRMNNVFSDINSFAEGFTFNNFNTLNRGNSLLENALQQTHSLRYFKYNLFNYTTIFGNLNYIKTTDPVVNRAFFNGIYQTSERVNASFENESLNGVVGYQRSFLKYYKGSLGVNLNWSKFNTLRVNPSNPADNSLDFVQTTESFSQTYRASMGTQYKTWPNLEVGYTLVLNDYQGTTFRTQQPFARLDYFFLNGFAFDATYDYFQYTNSLGTVNNTYDFLNTSLSYRKKNEAKMEYRVGVTNLLNTSSLNDDSFNQTSFRTSQYVVQPRYIVFSLKYNL